MRACRPKDAKSTPVRGREREKASFGSSLCVCVCVCVFPGPVLCKLGQPGALFVLLEVLTQVLRPSFVLFSRAFPSSSFSHCHSELLFTILTTWRPTRPFRTNTQERCPLHYRRLRCKVGNQETPGVTGKFGLGICNEARQRLIEFCREKALVSANTLFQQHKRKLYT